MSRYAIFVAAVLASVGCDRRSAPPLEPGVALTRTPQDPNKKLSVRVTEQGEPIRTQSIFRPDLSDPETSRMRQAFEVVPDIVLADGPIGDGVVAIIERPAAGGTPVIVFAPHTLNVLVEQGARTTLATALVKHEAPNGEVIRIRSDWTVTSSLTGKATKKLLVAGAGELTPEAKGGYNRAIERAKTDERRAVLGHSGTVLRRKP